MDKYYNTECFAYKVSRAGAVSCSALKQIQCEECKFAKTKAEFEKGK